jgi:hypothetical protein
MIQGFIERNVNKKCGYIKAKWKILHDGIKIKIEKVKKLRTTDWVSRESRM